MTTITWAGETVTFTTGRPSGPGIIPYESLKSAGSVAATSNQVATGQQVSFLPGVFEFVDFPANGYASLWWVNVAGVRGSGQTVFQMRANTSTAASRVPAQPAPGLSGVTNPLWLARVGGAGPNSKGVAVTTAVQLSGFTLNGTPQGHMYNGLQLYYADGTTLTDVKVKGIPGNNSANPGETFSIGTVQGRNITFTRVEVDGTDQTGKVVAASGVGLNNSDQITMNDCNIHDSQFGAGVTSYQCGSAVFNRVRSVNHLAGFNMERCAGGTYVYNQCESSGNPFADLIVDSDKGDTQVTIIDPIVNGKPVSAANPFRVTVHSDYWGSPQLQKWSSIKLIAGGVDHTADFLKRQANNVGE
jgi:hypothetical protein